MKVRLEHASWLASYAGGKGIFEPDQDRNLDVLPGTTARQLCTDLGLPLAEIGIYAVNAVKVDGATVLQAGDCLRLYPWVIGG